MGMNALIARRSSFFPGATQVSANGQRDANQRVTLDGVIASEPLVNTVYLNPSIDAIEEVKVQTGSYSAEYGMNNGANVQIALKSGTNGFTAHVYEFLRNDAADARDYFLNFQVPAGTPLQSKNRLRRNQFGAWLAGPVMLPHYKRQRQDLLEFQLRRHAADAGERPAEHLVPAGLPQRRFFRPADPADPQRQARSGARHHLRSADRRAFPRRTGKITNIIPPSRINKNAQNVHQQLSAAAAVHAGRYSRYQLIKPFRTSSIRINTSARIDHQFSSKDRSSGASPRREATICQNNINPNFPNAQHIQDYNVAFQHLHIFSPHRAQRIPRRLQQGEQRSVTQRSNTNFDVDSLGIGQFRVAVDNNRKFSTLETGIPPISGIIRRRCRRPRGSERDVSILG